MRLPGHSGPAGHELDVAEAGICTNCPWLLIVLLPQIQAGIASYAEWSRPQAVLWEFVELQLSSRNV